MIRLNAKITLWDSPGVIPYREHDSFKLLLIGSKNPDRVGDIEHYAVKFFEWFRQENPEAVKSLTGLDETADAEELLEAFAKKKNKLLKGGIPDKKNASMMLFQAWQKGKIKV